MTTYEQPDQSDLELETLVGNLLAQEAPTSLCHDIVLARIEALNLVGATISPFLQELEARLSSQLEKEAAIIKGLKILDELGL